MLGLCRSLFELNNLLPQLVSTMLLQLLAGLAQRDLGHAGGYFEFFQFVSADRSCCRVRFAFGLGRLDSCQAFFARFALGGFLLFFQTHALLAELEALSGLFGFGLLALQLAYFVFGSTVILHQRYF